jgi:hypothetical protein
MCARRAETEAEEAARKAGSQKRKRGTDKAGADKRVADKAGADKADGQKRKRGADMGGGPEAAAVKEGTAVKLEQPSRYKRQKGGPLVTWLAPDRCTADGLQDKTALIACRPGLCSMYDVSYMLTWTATYV